jgi:hypothetical protein
MYIEDHGTFYKPAWFEIVKDEYMACRKGVAVIDMSSFTKFELKVNIPTIKVTKKNLNNFSLKISKSLLAVRLSTFYSTCAAMISTVQLDMSFTQVFFFRSFH